MGGDVLLHRIGARHGVSQQDAGDEDPGALDLHRVDRGEDLGCDGEGLPGGGTGGEEEGGGSDGGEEAGAHVEPRGRPGARARCQHGW